MPPSQLKRLKASLQAEGILGPPQSKRRKKQDIVDGASREKRTHRASALRNIRDQFNPFELQLPSRDRDKFEVTSNKTIGGKGAKAIKGRPGVTKGHGEETRKRTLLKEMQQRNKIGGIVDRRFGEDDPTMTPEERMLQRFTKEKQRRYRYGTVFNLEDDQEASNLTHFGQSLSLDNAMIADDFDEVDLKTNDDESEGSGADHMFRKRKREAEFDEGRFANDDDPELPGRKKSKGEIMKEVVAKSKYHKYERQQAKEDDEEERTKLDKELPSLLAMMKGPQKSNAHSSDQPAGSNIVISETVDTFARNDVSKADKEYDMRLKEMIHDRRSRPTERTKTEDEKATEEAARLRALEEERLRRMRGEEDSSDTEDSEIGAAGKEDAEAAEPNDADAFGLGTSGTHFVSKRELDVEDEDDFILDDDLIASGPPSDLSDDEWSSQSGETSGGINGEDDEDEDFVNGILGDAPYEEPTVTDAIGLVNAPNHDLAYTYPCPQSLEEWLGIVHDIPTEDLPTVVQRIRTLYNPQLHSENKAKLGVFSTVLFEHIVHLSNLSEHPPLSVLGVLLRHIHSLAKAYPVAVATAFRSHLQSIHNERSTSPSPGDMIVFAAVANIFPTSDHFHQVVTPTVLSMARYLGQKKPSSIQDLAAGAFIGTLCLQYQQSTKRYVPELINYVLGAICSLAPTRPTIMPNQLPSHETDASLRIKEGIVSQVHRIRFWDIWAHDVSEEEEETLKSSLLHSFLIILGNMSELWVSHPAYIEIFSAALPVLQHLGGRPCSESLVEPIKGMISKTTGKLQILLKQARLSRRPLALHYHRPLAIKTSIPKFEEGYNPDKHYDPDQDRKELSKLKAEYKRERKGALRELRKDAHFIARETLREKKEKDREYEKKYKRLINEIQGEEGREAKLYEREKRMRKQRR